LTDTKSHAADDNKARVDTRSRIPTWQSSELEVVVSQLWIEVEKLQI